MSGEQASVKIGCGGVLLIFLAIVFFLGLLGMDSGALKGVAEPKPWVPSHIPAHGVVVDGTLYCPANTEANAAIDGCVPLKEEK